VSSPAVRKDDGNACEGAASRGALFACYGARSLIPAGFGNRNGVYAVEYMHVSIDLRRKVTSLIALRGVSKVYGSGIFALSQVDLDIRKGEFVFVVGPSGAGKSTLIKLLYREETPTEGQVVVGGKDLSKIRRRDVPYLRRKIGVVFQDIKLLEDRTVGENVAFALRVTGYAGRDVAKRVSQVLSLVGLKDRQDGYPPELSGGEQQRVAIARALVRNPDLLLADEPSGNLDPATSAEIFKLMERANMYGTTVVVATHARHIVDSMRKRVVELKKGAVVRDVRRGAYDY